MTYSGESISNEHLEDAIFTEAHQTEVGVSIISVSIVLIVAPLLCHNVKTNSFVLSAQLVGMLMGMIAVFLFYGLQIQLSTVLVRPYNVLTIYHTLMIVRFVYPMDYCVFRKALPHILVVSMIGWITSVICFSFLLITLAGELPTMTYKTLFLTGVLFTPMEIPSVILNIDQMKLTKVVMLSESVISSNLSIMFLNLLMGDMHGLFIYWYQPLCVLMRLFLGALFLGVPCGLIGGCLIPKYSSSCVYTMLLIITSNFLLYHVAQFAFCCSGGLCCFIYMLLVSRKRYDMPRQVDKDVCILIDMLFHIVSTVISFVVVCDTLPDFLDTFTLMTMAVSLALYICANTCRFVFFISIAPLLSRWGHGFTFKSLVTMVWCVKKGPLPFALLSIVILEGLDEMVPKKILILGLNYMFLTNGLNETSAWTVLKKMGITDTEFPTSGTNIKNAFKNLEKERVDEVTFMRINRLYRDANWKLIESITTLRSNHMDDVANTYEEFEKLPPFCTNCQLIVEYEPSKREYQDMLTEVRLRILNEVRVSFVRQYESGFMDISSLRVLNSLLDEAMETKRYTMNIDSLLAMLTKTHYNNYIEKLRRIMFKHDNELLKARYVPRYPKCYNIMTKLAFQCFYDFLAVILFFTTIVGAFSISHYVVRELQYVYISLILMLYVEFVILLMGSISTTTKEGFQRYIRKVWNKVDFALLMIDTVNTLLLAFVHNYTWYTNDDKSKPYLYHLFLAMHCIKLLRIIRLARWITPLQIAIVTMYDRRVESTLCHVYSTGQSVVVSYEEVDEILHTLASVPTIVKNVRLQLQEDRNKIARQLGSIEMKRPWVIHALKTRQTMLCMITTMLNAVDQLRTDGIMDMLEYIQLHEVVHERWKEIAAKKIILRTCPRNIFYQISWIGSDQKVFDFLYENVMLRVFDAGDVIYKQEDVAEGVLILITGMLKVIYTPSEKVLDRLYDYGLLPVKDMIRHHIFDFPTVEYISLGHSIGELSVMTGRPYCCDIIAETPIQAFVISTSIMVKALTLSPDPINGLFSRIWMHISFKFVKRLLREESVYSGIKLDKVNKIMVRSFVAKMDAYEVFRSNDHIEEIVLVEGSVVDFITRETFIAPCVIPRGSPGLIIMDNLSLNSFDTKPKIWIIPKQDMDPYEVMMYSEQLSNLNNKAPSDTFLLKDMQYQKWHLNRRRYNSLFGGISFRTSKTRKEMHINKMLEKVEDSMGESPEGFFPVGMVDDKDFGEYQQPQRGSHKSKTNEDKRMKLIRLERKRKRN